MAGPQNIENLLARAAASRRAGDLRGALAAVGEALASAPGDPRALNAQGSILLQSGDAAQARGALERAVRADPAAAPVWYNLALACAAQGDAAAEESAIRSALAADPVFLPALLGIGKLLARTGRGHSAASEFRNAIEVAEGLTGLPDALKRELDAARTFVAQDSENRAEAYREAVRARLGSAALAGDEASVECLEAFAGTRRIYRPEPALLDFPGLPTIRFFDRALFPWLEAAEARTDAIREEYLAVRQAAAGDFVPYVAMPEGRPLNQWEELNNNTDWDSFHLLQNGVRIEAHCAACPEAVAASISPDQPHITGNSPNAMFSRLKPGTHIPPHCGMTNTRLVTHLPLVVPEGCWFRVGSETRYWREGEAWVFDDTIEHEAMNPTAEERIILMWDIWHPMLNPQQREIVTALVEAYNAYEAAPG